MIKFPGGHRGRVTPVPIPNTEVKPATADGTACVGVWESRSLPGLFQEGPAFERAFFFSRDLLIPWPAGVFNRNVTLVALTANFYAISSVH